MEQIKQRICYDDSVITGIGDDAAVLSSTADTQLLISTDTLVVNRHFRIEDKAADIGFKSLAVSISDLAAMGATPRWATLNLTLPSIDQNWFNNFTDGFCQLLQQHLINLVGGDTTQGPLSITVTLIGECQPQHIKRRSDAQAGDLIVVSGQLGSAAYALQHADAAAELQAKLHRPQPRLDIAQHITTFAHAVIDVSDGLVADLQHICQASQVGAVIHTEKLPLHQQVKQHPQGLHYALSGGDDYELCFTCKPSDQSKLPEDCTVIGYITAEHQVHIQNQGKPMTIQRSGFEHFHD
ncbi:thiamine-phosphate kinase [Marinicella sp. W31]|uniref:thiamine-phosphate kinase n=1 Tax=Marinicella sp. W31 TaxID=3023713 RepID=UPI003757259F